MRESKTGTILEMLYEWSYFSNNNSKLEHKTQ